MQQTFLFQFVTGRSDASCRSIIFLSDLGLVPPDPKVDMLSTTPQKMLRALDIVLQLWEKSLKGAHIGDSDPSSLESQSAKLMKPHLIKEIEGIAATIRRKYT